MGEMRASDWSRAILLRSDWLGLLVAIMTTNLSSVQTICTKKLVENYEYRVKDFKVHVSRQGNQLQFTGFKFVFSPFTKIKNT